jgi:hypothetical protein
MIQITDKFLILHKINVKKNILQRKLRKDKELMKQLKINIKINEYSINFFINEEDIDNLRSYFNNQLL